MHTLRTLGDVEILGAYTVHFIYEYGLYMLRLYFILFKSLKLKIQKPIVDLNTNNTGVINKFMVCLIIMQGDFWKSCSNTE